MRVELKLTYRQLRELLTVLSHLKEKSQLTRQKVVGLECFSKMVNLCMSSIPNRQKKKKPFIYVPI